MPGLATLTPSPDRASRKAPGGLLRGIFTLAVSLFAVWFLWRVLREVGLANLWGRLASADGPLVGLVILLTVARFLLQAIRWEILARREAPVGLAQITPIMMAGHFLSLVTPAVRIAGPILRAYYLSRQTGLPRARFYGTIVADQTSNFTAYAVAACLAGALAGLPDGARPAPVAAAGLLAALVGGLIGGYVMLREVHRGGRPRFVRAMERLLGPGPPNGWRRRLAAWWDQLIHSLSSSVIGSGAWWPSLGLSFAAFGVTAAAQALSLSAVGARLGWVDACFVVAGAGLIQVMAAAPGGPGVTEASLLGVLLALGVDREPAAAGVIIARLATYAVLLPWGGLAFITLQRRYGAPRDTAGEATA